MLLHTLTPLILLIYCITSASVGMAQSFASTDEWVEPVTGMTFIYVKGGCYKMGCEDNGVFANSIPPHREATAYSSIAEIPVWQWPLAVVAAFLPVGCMTGRSYYDRTVCSPDEQPAHEVCVDNFWMSKYEVTEAEFRKILKSHQRPSKKMANHPVVGISLEDIQTFLSKLTVRSRGKYKLSNEEIRDYPVYRLPTEAEWEYAARSGGKMEKYAGGNNVDSIGWYYKNSGSSTHEVGTKSPNGLRLYDMSGNVKELCSDLYGYDYYKLSPRSNPQGPPVGSTRLPNYSSASSSKSTIYNGSYHISRGGSWADDAGYLTTVKREYELYPEFLISSQFGFRPVFSEERSTGRLTVETSPPDVRLRILNIASRYVPGMELEAGSYQVEVSRSGYITTKRSVSISAGENITLPIHLTEIPQPTTGPAAGETHWMEPITGMEFVFVPGGCFQMGSPRGEEGHNDREKQHEVCVDGIWMGKYEVTNEQFRKLQPDHNSKEFEGESLNGGSQPVVYVSWEEARDYARKLSGKSGWNFRLPTEAEWEHAARGGTTSAYFWGDNPDQICEFANVQDGTAGKTFHMSRSTIQDCSDGYAVTAPVGSFKANSYGLCDMLGNVSELCSDWYDDDYYKSSPRHSPQGASSGYSHVLRGGDWRSHAPSNVRSAFRYKCSPDYRRNDLGFRLAFQQGNR